MFFFPFLEQHEKYNGIRLKEIIVLMQLMGAYVYIKKLLQSFLLFSLFIPKINKKLMKILSIDID